MFAPNPVYSNRRCIPIIFDAADAEQAALLRAFEASFGERSTRSERTSTRRATCV